MTRRQIALYWVCMWLPTVIAAVLTVAGALVGVSSLTVLGFGVVLGVFLQVWAQAELIAPNFPFALRVPWMQRLPPDVQAQIEQARADYVAERDAERKARRSKAAYAWALAGARLSPGRCRRWLHHHVCAGQGGRPMG